MRWGLATALAVAENCSYSRSFASRPSMLASAHGSSPKTIVPAHPSNRTVPMIHGILAAVMSSPPPPTDPGTHWDGAHERVGDHGGSWYQREPRVALELIHGLGMAKTTPVVDIGGGSSKLVDALLRDGFLDISVLDVSP